MTTETHSLNNQPFWTFTYGSVRSNIYAVSWRTDSLAYITTSQ